LVLLIFEVSLNRIENVISKQDIYSAVTAVLAIALLYLVFHLVGIGCPIRFLTGVSCPGCGMTRAALSLLCLRFSDALYYHPLVFLMPVVLAVFLLKRRIPLKTYRFLLFTMIVMFGIVYTIRLLDPSNEVVAFHPDQGFIYRAIKHFIH